MVVVVEQPRVAAPVRHDAQRLFRAARIEMILELQFEALTRRAMPCTLVQHFVDMRGKRHELDDMLSKQTPPGLVVAVREHVARRAQPEGAVVSLGKGEQMERRGGRMEHVDPERERRGNRAEFRMAVVRRGRQGLDEPGEMVARHVG